MQIIHIEVIEVIGLAGALLRLTKGRFAQSPDLLEDCRNFLGFCAVNLKFPMIQNHGCIWQGIDFCFHPEFCLRRSEGTRHFRGGAGSKGEAKFATFAGLGPVQGISFHAQIIIRGIQ